MEVASERDMESIQENKPAIEKFKMLKEVRRGLDSSSHASAHAAHASHVRLCWRMPPMSGSAGAHVCVLEGTWTRYR